MALQLPTSSREWDLYRTLLSIGCLKKLDLITADLTISLPTLRRRLARLEVVHACKLARFADNRYSLTSAGQTLINDLHAVDDVLGGFNDFGYNSTTVSREVLQIRSSGRVLEEFWLPFIAVKLELFYSFRVCFLTPESLETVSTGPMSVSVGSHFTVSSLDQVEHVGASISCFAAYEKYIQKFGQPTADNLKDHVFIRVKEASRDAHFLGETETVERRCNHSFLVDSYGSAHCMAKAGLGFTVHSGSRQTSISGLKLLPLLGRSQTPVHASFCGDAWRGGAGLHAASCYPAVASDLSAHRSIVSGARRVSKNVPASLSNWNLIRSFLALSYFLEYTAAAQELGVSVPTLRRRIDRLESFLNCRLFIYERRVLQLTPDGQQAIEIATQADRIMGEVRELQGSRQTAARPCLNLSMDENVLHYFWVPFAARNAARLSAYQTKIDVD